jgi:type IV pilus biogenesis protein PilP
MAADKTKGISDMTTRQKATIGLVVVVVIFLIWQVMGMFGGSKLETPPPVASAQPSKSPFGKPPVPGATTPTAITGGAPGASTSPSTPQATTAIPAAPVLTQREAELLKLQQETEAKYLTALNELQILKIDREIAETNKAIASAKLDMVTAQKNIIELLTAPPSSRGGMSQQSGPPGQRASAQQAPAAPAAPVAAALKEPSYSVVSISQLQYRWTAVLTFQNNLYSVHVGDVVPADGSKVISIDKSGVMLEKEGVKKKVAMAPII